MFLTYERLGQVPFNLLFAYRDDPQESLRFSPLSWFKHEVCGSMKIIRKFWTKEVEDPEVWTTYQFVADLKERVVATCKMARENLKRSSGRYRNYYEKNPMQRQMVMAEFFFVLLPTASNKLRMHWKSSFTIIEKVGKTDYNIDIGEKKTWHVNMFKL